jgi:DNA-binding NarL/FixJ family response regulator
MWREAVLVWGDRQHGQARADGPSEGPGPDAGTSAVCVQGEGQASPATDPIRLLVVDDHATFRAMLISLLSSWDDIEVVGECEDGAEVLEAADRLHPDVVLMDLSMPVLDGDEATKILHAAHPDLPVVMLTALGAAAVPRATAAGANAIVPKDGDTETLLRCVREVAGR